MNRLSLDILLSLVIVIVALAIDFSWWALIAVLAATTLGFASFRYVMAQKFQQAIAETAMQFTQSTDGSS